MAGSLMVVSLAATALFVVLVILAHILNPEINARWRMLSELSIGRRGWVMNVAFLAWSASNIALALGLWSVAPSDEPVADRCEHRAARRRLRGC